MPGKLGTILVIDDDYSIRRSVVELLESEGFETLEARNGLEGTEILRACIALPSLILLDLNIPLLSGREFIDEIQKNSLYETIPIVVLSSNPDQLPIEYDVTARLKKPFKGPVLLKTIREII